MPTEFFIIGAGGHGKVVLEALVNEGKCVQVYDADPKKQGARCSTMRSNFTLLI